MSTTNLILTGYGLTSPTTPDTTIRDTSGNGKLFVGNSRGNDILFVQFDPSSLRGKRLLDLALKIGIYFEYRAQLSVQLYAVTEAFDATAVTYNTQPAKRAIGSPYSITSSLNRWTTHTLNVTDAASALSLWAHDALVYGVAFEFSNSNSTYPYVYVASSSGASSPITAQVSYDTGSTAPTIALSSGPTSGTVDRNTRQTYAWEISLSEFYSPEVLSLERVELRWRPEGTSSWRTIDCGSVSQLSGSYNLAPNTFTVGSNQFLFRLYYNNGSTSDTDTYTIDYVDTGAASVSLLAPVNSSIPLGNPISFSWRFSGPVASCQFRILSGSSAVVTRSFSASTTSFDYSSSTLGVGSYTWQVMPIGEGQTVGEWSAPASFSVTSAPASASPSDPTSGTREGGEARTLKWTVSGNLPAPANYVTELNWRPQGDSGWWGYTINGATQKTFDPAKFPPGVIEWRVRTKNADGFWSDWSAWASFTISYSATSQVVPVNTPTDGAIDRQTAQTFTVGLEASLPVYTPFTIASAVLHWREAGTSAWNDVNMLVDNVNARTAAAVVARDTFPVGSVEWYAEATDNTGSTTSTPVYTVSTVAGTIQAYPVSPVGTIESDNAEILLTWRFVSVTGSPATGTDIQWRLGSGSWITLSPAIVGEDTSVSVPAGTFPAGTIFWRTRAYDNGSPAAPGEWSDPASFLVFGAPTVSAVRCDERPFAKVQWTCDEQQAYQIRVDDGAKVFGPIFGAENSYVLPDYLEGGEHRVEVRAQNNYGIWSAWEGVDVVTRAANGNRVLTVTTGYDAVLSWTPTTHTNRVCSLVYRDNVQIAKLPPDATSYVDRTVLGRHEYKVIQRHETRRYYRFSPAEPVTVLSTDWDRIAALAGGEWIELKTSTQQHAEQTWRASRTVRYMQVLGAVYPVAEKSAFREFEGSFFVSWFNDDPAADAFEALIGEAVIFKSVSGRVLIGILDAVELPLDDFFRSYRFSLRKMHWSDFTNEVD